MRKLLIVDHIVNAGGVERYLQGILSGLSDINAIKEWQITVLLNSKNTAGNPLEWTKELKRKGFKVHFLYEDPFSKLLRKLRVPNRIWGLKGTTFLLSKISAILKRIGNKRIRASLGDVKSYIEIFVEEGKFDLVYFNFPFCMDPPQINAKTVLIPHDMAHRSESAPPTSSLIERQLPGWLNLADKIVISSNFISEEIKKNYPSVFHKVSVIRAGMPEEKNVTIYPQEFIRFEKEKNLPENYFLFPGWLTAHKNQLVLIKAMGLLKKQGFNSCAVFVGPGTEGLSSKYRYQPKYLENEYLQKILQEAENNNLIEGVDYIGIGYVTDSLLQSLYSHAQALVVGSFYEAGSFPIREALLKKCPVVCSNIPSLVEENQLLGETLYLYSPDSGSELSQQLIQVMTHPKEAKEKAESGCLKAKKVFSWKEASQKYNEIFKQLVSA